MTDLPPDPFRVGVNDPVHPGEADRFGGWTWETRAGDHHRSCSFCGSIHPHDVPVPSPDGTPLHWADWKYGWPHKAYGEYPNPHPERLEVLASTNSSSGPTSNFGLDWYPVTNVPEGINWEPWAGAKFVGVGVKKKIWITLYTIHLRDPEIEEEHRDRIFAQLGIRLTFEKTANGPTVVWERYEPR